MSIPFLYPPEAPYTERLRALTNILGKKTGIEQRIALRLAPRQSFEMNFTVDQITQRPIIENILFSAQQNTFSLPLWSDVSYITSPVTATDTTINLDTTVSDFRDGNNLLIIDPTLTKSEIQTITSQGTASIALTAGTTYSWPVGTQVIPLQDCLIGNVVKSSRSPVGLSSYTITFNVLDASSNLGITPPPYNYLGIGTDGYALVVDDPNLIEDVIQESNDMNIIIIDSNSGAFTNITYWDIARRGSVKSWITTNRTGLWRVRKFFHQMNGQLTSFFMPTFAHDVTPVANITSGSSTMNVVNVGLTAYSGLGNEPRQYIRLELANQTTYTAAVLSTSIISGTVEQITINGTWPSNITYTNIARVTILERVRFASDDLTITHNADLGYSKITCPVIAVIEGDDETFNLGSGPIQGTTGGGGTGGMGTGGGSPVPNPMGIVPCVIDGSSPPTIILTVSGGIVTSGGGSWCGNGTFTCSGGGPWGTNAFCDTMGSQGIACAAIGDGSNLPVGSWYYFESRVQLNTIIPITGGSKDSPSGGSGFGNSLSGDVTGISISVA